MGTCVEFPGGSTAATNGAAIVQQGDIGGGAVALAENHAPIRFDPKGVSNTAEANRIFRIRVQE